jgi:DNA-binding GntR family transcriptional regulator
MQQSTGYSRQTCGKAMRLLEQEGLLQRVPGLGYHITTQPGQPPGNQPAVTGPVTDPGHPPAR